MKRAFLFMTCLMASLAMSAQGSDTYFDYIPFVKEGKAWHVVSFSFDRSCRFTQYKLTNEKVVKNGKTYIKMDLNSDGMIVYDAALLREENRKVYRFDPDLQKEVLLFDYSLKAGDTYEAYSFDAMKERSYKVLSVDDCLEGPKIVRYVESADSMTTQYRYLRKWTVCLTGNSSLQKTWIEGVGSLNGPFDNLYDMSPGYSQYLAYTIDDDYVNSNSYLPFPLYDKSHQAHGCNLPTGEADPSDWRHQLTYELEGDRLHVYGKAYTQCGPNNYAYFIEKPTDDPLVHKIEFVIQDVNPVANCMFLHAINIYVSGFDPNMNYIVVDNQGGEHPVVNKTPQNAYRPFIEEGKVWKVGTISGNPVQVVDCYYFDGDTIIGGKTCKQMMCQRYVAPDYSNDYWAPQPSLSKVGAWYEENQKVYYYDERKRSMVIKYDFSLNANDTLLLDNYPYVIGPKQTGGLKGFKGVYRDVLTDHNTRSTTWLEGVGGVDGPTRNAYAETADLVPEFLMSCTVGDEVIYLNDEMEDGATPEGARKGRIDFTHTIKIKPKARITRGAETPLYAEYSNQQLGINLDPLDDAYLVRIADETGKAIYEKAVNAGNIVGLNIDISAYAEGRYTITIENSSETFTGRFETQPTGIKEAKSKCLETKGAIYDLQGRRLAAPPAKGVYIQDGRMVLK
jgi:hypothetical protein